MQLPAPSGVSEEVRTGNSQFQLPEDSQLLSAIYWISASEVPSTVPYVYIIIYIYTVPSSGYYNFGMNLLQDENGDKVDLIKRDYSNEEAEAITRTILKKWLGDVTTSTRTGSTC